MQIKALDQEGLSFIMANEGNVLHPYLDQAGIPTIGCGMTYYPATGKRVTMKDNPITLQQSLDMFRLIVKPYEISVWSLTRDDINQHQFNALVDFNYNAGASALKGSTLLAMINSKANNASIQKAFFMWNKIHVNGVAKIDQVAVLRRQKEFALYSKIAA